MSALPWPEPITRDGPYKVYKGTKYGVYDDGHSAETPYQTDLAEAAMSRLQIALATLKDIRDHAHTLEDAKGYADEAILDMGDIP